MATDNRKKEVILNRTGKVAAINPARGMVAVATEDDGYTIIELPSHFELEIGDELTWANGYRLSSWSYANSRKGETQRLLFRIML